MTLAEALSPVDQQTFMRDYAGERFLVVRGTRGRFHDLVPWDDLDETLSRLRVTDGRVSLVNQARELPRDSYIESSLSGRVKYLNGPAVRQHVNQGATLVVNQVDELFPRLRQLAESCEETFRNYVSANLYAGWRRDRGFETHWDSHDTLIVQIRGRKDWKVWAPTVTHPLPGDGRDMVPPPTEPPVWEGTLEDGDTLYMPRGWWHVACPRDEPSLHITFGISLPSGLDLLRWSLDRLRAALAVRSDVPHWKSTADQRQWMQSLRDACVSVLSDDLLAQFMEHLTERAHSRPVVRLPRSAEETRPPTLHRLASLRLSRGGPFVFRRSNGAGTLAFDAQGREWTCPDAVAPALGLLHHLKPCTLQQMEEAVDVSVRQLLPPLVTALILANVIWMDVPPISIGSANSHNDH